MVTKLKNQGLRSESGFLVIGFAFVLVVVIPLMLYRMVSISSDTLSVSRGKIRSQIVFIELAEQAATIVQRNYLRGRAGECTPSLLGGRLCAMSECLRHPMYPDLNLCFGTQGLQISEYRGQGPAFVFGPSLFDWVTPARASILEDWKARAEIAGAPGVAVPGAIPPGRVCDDVDLICFVVRACLQVNGCGPNDYQSQRFGFRP